MPTGFYNHAGKAGNFQKGMTPWNKGKKGFKRTPEAIEKGRQKRLGTHLSEETKRKIGEANAIALKGRVPAYNFTCKGKKASLETRLKMSLARRGKSNWNWQGGKTEESFRIRHSMEYRLWREAVFERDNWTCVLGGKKHGSKLQADHIKPFSTYPELRFAIDNGRTLCILCHKQTETYGFNRFTAKKILEQTKND